MKTTLSFALFVVGSLLVSVGSMAEEVPVRPNFGFNLHGVRAPMPDAVDSGSMAFVGDLLSIELVLVAMESPGWIGNTDTPGLEALVVDPQWWSEVEIIVKHREDSDAPRVPAPETIVWKGSELDVVRSEIVRQSEDEENLPDRIILRGGDLARVVVELPPLSSGDYVINSRMYDTSGTRPRSMIGAPKHVAIRKGDENPAVYHTFLRARREGQDFETFRRMTLELAEKFEPKNWSLWAELGNASITHVSPEQTVAYYDRAYELYVDSLHRQGKNLETLSRGENDILSYLTLFRRLYPLVKEHHGDMYLMPTTDGGRLTYHWRDSETNRRIERVDPDRPGLDERKIPRPR